LGLDQKLGISKKKNLSMEEKEKTYKIEDIDSELARI